MHKLANNTMLSVYECSSGPSFLLLFESILEQTSELEDTIDVDGQRLAIFLPLEVLK